MKKLVLFFETGSNPIIVGTSRFIATNQKQYITTNTGAFILTSGTRALSDNLGRMIKTSDGQFISA